MCLSKADGGKRCPCSGGPLPRDPEARKRAIEKRRNANKTSSAAVYKKHQQDAVDIALWVETIPVTGRVQAIQARLRDPDISGAGKWATGKSRGLAGVKKALEFELDRARKAARRERRRQAAKARAARSESAA